MTMNIHFVNPVPNANVVLGTQQIEAFNLIKEFISNNELAFSLSGYAGSGKSLMIAHVVNYLEQNNLNYQLCAPTHKAKIVLENFTDREAVTVHKLLSLAPQLDILELDFNYLKFNTTSNEFPTKNIIIIDESSMINDSLFDLLMERCTIGKSKIIFVGDIAQLSPVNNPGFSKVFNLKSNYSLTDIYRQNNESALNELLLVNRDTFVEKFETMNSKHGSIITFNGPKDFLLESVKYFKKAINSSNILETKLLSYTNSRVEIFNEKIRNAIFDKNIEYNKLEFLTAKENFTFNNNKYWNSMDYIISGIPYTSDIIIPEVGSFPVWNLELYDSANKETTNIHILRKDISKDLLDLLIESIESARTQAVNAKNKGLRSAGKLWQKYFKIMGSFTTPYDLYFEGRLIRKKSFDYGYATTIHRSQGSSYNNVFVDMKSIASCRTMDEKRQLQYVALSRTKNNVNILI